jgi:hypothetical protein
MSVGHVNLTTSVERKRARRVRGVDPLQAVPVRARHNVPVVIRFVSSLS